jgi:hypothetical protein
MERLRSNLHRSQSEHNIKIARPSKRNPNIAIQRTAVPTNIALFRTPQGVSKRSRRKERKGKLDLFVSA